MTSTFQTEGLLSQTSGILIQFHDCLYTPLAADVSRVDIKRNQHIKSHCTVTSWISIVQVCVWLHSAGQCKYIWCILDCRRIACCCWCCSDSTPLESLQSELNSFCWCSPDRSKCCNMCINFMYFDFFSCLKISTWFEYAYIFKEISMIYELL